MQFPAFLRETHSATSCKEALIVIIAFSHSIGRNQLSSSQESVHQLVVVLKSVLADDLLDFVVVG